VQHHFYNLLISEKTRGKTIFLSSHILPEVERVCDRVGIVRDGQLVSIEKVADLKFKKVRRMELSLGREIPLEKLKLEGFEIIEAKGMQIQLKVTSANIQKILTQLSKLPV